jgi:hypothetical protein
MSLFGKIQKVSETIKIFESTVSLVEFIEKHEIIFSQSNLIKDKQTHIKLIYH